MSLFASAFSALGYSASRGQRMISFLMQLRKFTSFSDSNLIGLDVWNRGSEVEREDLGPAEPMHTHRLHTPATRYVHRGDILQTLVHGGVSTLGYIYLFYFVGF